MKLVPMYYFLCQANSSQDISHHFYTKTGHYWQPDVFTEKVLFSFCLCRYKKSVSSWKTTDITCCKAGGRQGKSVFIMHVVWRTSECRPGICYTKDNPDNFAFELILYTERLGLRVASFVHLLPHAAKIPCNYVTIGHHMNQVFLFSPKEKQRCLQIKQGNTVALLSSYSSLTWE